MAKKIKYDSSMGGGVHEVKDKKTNKVVGYSAASHRGGMVFVIGDTLFDGRWKMPKTHKDYAKYKKMADKSEFANTVEEVIPYKERGSVKCKTLSDCKKAATNFYKHIA